ncbi:MAG: TonB-dependent receptor [Tannerellaceae bacterium]|jgi:TonB-linked SusC/RagA family outer membrane protein|nr:TonB-dependent receptor [Tannerellaceae bacterium]
MQRRIAGIIALFLLLCTTSLYAQNISIQGKVTDTNNEPLIGVSVQVKGTTIGVVTDIDGNFTLQVPGAQSVIAFSYVGFLSQEITVGSQRRLNVILKEDTKNLEEIVVVGYGTQRKETVTGSVSTVKGMDLVKTPTANLSNAIAGRLSGVVTFQRSGEPGYDETTIRIRGSNTLGNNDPLVVIDGVAARAGGLERLNPNEIENMSVLKDAAAAIYGARAANGVILITTKKGKASKKPELSYSFNQGWGRPGMLPKMADAAQYAEMRNELIVNSAMVNPTSPNYNPSAPPPTLWKTPEEIQKYKDGSDPWRYPNTDWFKETYADWSPQSIHNATIEGGTDKSNYFASFGYTSQDGYWKNSANDYKQYSLRINLNAELNEWMKVGVNLMGRQENRNFPSQGAGDILWFTVRGRPTDPGFWPNGLPGPAQEYGRNPVIAASSETGYDRDKRYYIQTNANLEISQPWIKGLKLNLTVSYDKYLQHRKKWFQAWYLYDWDKKTYEDDGVTPKLVKALSYPSSPDSKLDMFSEDQTNMVTSAILNYDRKFGNHSIAVVAGTEKDLADNSYFEASRRYFISNAVQIFKAGGDKEKSNGSGDWKKNWERARLNYFGRVAYNYQEKYLAEFNWRYDASYMFPEDKRYGFFPGVLVGYRISEEPFWKEKLSFLDYFKIRGSWGQMGNDQVWFDDKLQEYQYLATYYYEWGYIINNEDKQGLRASRFPNNNITWEVASNMNIGIEGRTLNNRLYFEADYFKNRRSNILWRRNASVPQTAGLTLPAENIGKVNNTGFDFKVEWNDAIGKDFSYRLSATGGYAKNTIIFWDEAAGAKDWQKSTGHPMNTDLYYIFDGVFKDWNEINDKEHRPDYSGITSDANLQPGDMKFKDVDNNGIITPDDRVRMDKNNEPKWVYGLNATLQWKQFDMSFLFQGAADSWAKVYFDSGEIGNYLKSVYDNHWSVDNPTSEHPRLHKRGEFYWDGTAAGSNTYWMQSTSYLRLKNMEIGYSIPKNIVNKTKYFSYMRVFANGQNLMTFSPSKDLDPEMAQANGTRIPMPQIFNIGFTVTF